MKAHKLLSLCLLMGQCIYGEVSTEQLAPSASSHISLPLSEEELEKNWNFAYQETHDADENSSFVMEWIPKGEEIENWSKLIQIQYLPFESKETTFNAKQFGDAFLKTLSENYPGATGKVTPTSDSRVLIEWSLPKDNGDEKAQSELAEVITTTDGLYRVAYTEKGATMDPQAKNLWIDRLSKIEVK